MIHTPRRAHIRRAALGAICLGLVACASTAATPSSTNPPSAPIATPAPARTTPAPVAAAQPLLLAGAANKLYIVDLQGKVNGTIATADADQFGTGPHHIWVVDGSHLKFYGPTGDLLATDAWAGSETTSPVFSSDGSEWFWSDYISGDQSASVTFYEGTQAHQVRKVGTVSAPFGTGAPQPIAVRNGVVYVDDSIYGGDNIYDSGSSLSTLNLSTGKLTPIAGGACTVEDVGNDGSFLCTNEQGNAETLHLANGTTHTWTVGRAVNLPIGEAGLAPDNRSVWVLAPAQGGEPTSFKVLVGATGTTALTSTSLVVGGGRPAFLPDGRAVLDDDNTVTLTTVGGARSTITLPAGTALVGVIDDPGY